ncbi:hypothetical protein OHA18_25930 [Kribbella sp. NBC_00709]|uniref:hypothetical protein n=1 Tax=Kribbella sp. NBC_00709 TaxID=2975972 RepID=UPI002E2D812A|nr:hypothetical protein [Kribbella sp. NBC_00709]
MFDQMSMPVLFAVLIVTLALVSTGIFVAVRVMAVRVGADNPVEKGTVPDPSHRALSQPAAARRALESNSEEDRV